MSLKMKKMFAVWCLLSILMVFAVAGGAHAYSSVLAFGDSLSDNGQYALNGTPYAAAGNNNPYDGFGFRRFSNGPVWVEYLASSLGASLLDMAYGGATSGADNPAAGLTITGLQWQAGAYASTFGPIADDTLITISAGGNDMFNNRSATDAAANIAGVISYLMSIGGDAFMVMNLSPGQQNTAYTEWMTTFNATLAAYLAGLGSNPNIDLFLLDMTAFVPVVDNMTGTWIADCAANPSACANTTYAWYDQVGVHPTTEIHQQIGEYARRVAVPEPASIILFILGFAGLAGMRRRMK